MLEEKWQPKITDIQDYFIDLKVRVGYHWELNGYSLIPSWWRDRPYETQQPAKIEMPLKGSFYFEKVLT